MRVVIQRVAGAKVEVGGQIAGQIDKGLLVYLSVGVNDCLKDAQFTADKLVNLRIFADKAGKMNLSVIDTGGSILLVSNFTLHGDCRKGRRPSFDAAAEPNLARQLYEKVAELIAATGVTVQTGIFAKHMQVSSTNDGPITFMLDTFQ
jgi:D-tyrosyl-tRNA(Tyr) deacylase